MPQHIDAYRPHLRSWLLDVRDGMPARAIPTADQVDQACHLAACPLPRTPGLVVSYAAAYSLVWAQAVQQRKSVEGMQSIALMLALSWDKVMVEPDRKVIERIMRAPSVPDGALLELAALPKQTYYVLLELPAEHDFIAGAWMTLDFDSTTQQRTIMILLDLVRDGQHVRDALYEFVPHHSFHEGIEAQLKRSQDRLGGDAQQTDAWRAFLRSGAGLVAIIHAALVGGAEQTARRLPQVPEDSCGFRLVSHGSAMPQPVAVQ